MWMRMIVHVHLVIWCEKRCIQQERLNFEISPPIGNYLCLSNFRRLSNNNRNQMLKGFSIKLRFFSLCFLFVLFFSMENVTTQCDILTDYLNAKSHDCFGSFVLRFGIVFDSVNWNSIKHRLWCGSYENLTCIRMDTLFFHRLSMQIDTQRDKSCDANPSIMCTFADDFSHIEYQLINRRKKHTK